MKRPWLALLCLLTGLAFARGQDQSLTVDDLKDSAEQWANENLDENFLRSLKQADRDKVRQFFTALQKQFQGEYVIDLARFREIANSVLPILDSYEETAPYAAWLKTRLDYLDVAEQFRLIIPPPKTEPGQPPKPAPNPPPKMEREVWVKRLADRASPENAPPLALRLKPVFAQQQVPPELVWLAEVESSFDPSAKSPAGAAGLFQLMPATAKRFGLRSWPRDQRYGPEDSARAAAKYLQFLHSEFKDWRLALAAYNAGEGTVQKLLKKHHAKTFDEISPYLPAETQMYVPKFEATLLRREGLKLSDLHTPTREG